MIEFKPNIIYNPLKAVYVYKNLNKNCYSIKQNNIVIAYGNNFILTNCNFIVRKSGRDLVLKTKQKNVHAFVKGYFSDVIDNPLIKHKIVYNPYKQPYFFEENKEYIELKEVSSIFFTETGIYSC